ncbi:odorant receptor 13a-like [Prorops nasuta]|uniref:odorant receptor 13a-like n=1 Tax=Prorops nasuta TaxID=863751 RepID=UPI0034CE6820
MAFYQQHYYKLNEKIMRFFGFWPEQDSVSALIRRSYMLTYFWAALIMQIKYLAKKCDNFDSLMNVIPELVMNVAVTISFMCLFPKRKNYNGIYEIMCYDWTTKHTEEEIKIKELYAKKGKNISIAGFAYSVCIVIPLGVAEILFQMFKKTLPDYYIILNFNPKYQFLNGVFWSMFMFLLGMCIASNTLMLMVNLFHVFGMVDVIGHRLGNLNVRKCKSLGEKDHYESVKNDILFCIEKHSLVIKFISRVERHYKPCILVCLIVAVLVLSLTMVQTLKFDKLHIKSLVTTTGELCFLAAICFVTQSLIDSFDQMSTQIYNTEWYTFPVRIQKLVCFMLHRANTPCFMTENAFFALSNQKFGEVMKTAISFYMVFRTFQ